MSRFWSPVVHDLTPYVPGEQPKLANLVKLAETERRVTPGVPRRKGGGAELFDGLTVFKPDGDMLRNLFRRIEATAALDDIAGPILQEIAQRVEAYLSRAR